MDKAGNLRGSCMRHGNHCEKYTMKTATSHNCTCGCSAFEHVSIDKPLLSSIGSFFSLCITCGKQSEENKPLELG